MGLTLEEQERRAYISGNTELAAALAAALDAQGTGVELTHAQDRIEELEDRIRELEDEVSDLAGKPDSIRRAVG